MWAAEPQPGVHARPQPGIGADVPIRHLEVGELRGVEHLPLGHQQPETLPSERDQRGEGHRPGAVLEEERRGVVKRSDAERSFDQPHRPVLTGEVPVALARVAHQDGVAGKVHRVHLGELRRAEQRLRGGHQRCRQRVALGGVGIAGRHQARRRPEREPSETGILGDRPEARRVGGVAAVAQKRLEAELHAGVILTLLCAQPGVDLEARVLVEADVAQTVHRVTEDATFSVRQGVTAAAARAQRPTAARNASPPQCSVTTVNGRPARTIALAVSCAPWMPWL